MDNVTHVDVIIPAFNEEQSIASVLKDIPSGLVREVIVVNNASTDRTEEVAAEAGATVLLEKRKGYGSACLKGLAYVAAKPEEEKPQIIVFLDADYSDYPQEMPELLQPIIEGEADLVIGSRALGEKESGSMMPQQIFGNWLATTLIRWLYKIEFTDLGPFRAIDYQKLLQLEMCDANFGWTVEMQVKAAKAGMKCVEVPMRYRKRIGTSKIAGTIKGTILAGYKIIWTIFKFL